MRISDYGNISDLSEQQLLLIDSPETGKTYNITIQSLITSLVKIMSGRTLPSEHVITADELSSMAGGRTWYIDTDRVVSKTGVYLGSMSNCMTDAFAGSVFYVRTESSEAGSAAYPSKYTIDGANSYMSLRDYVMWTGRRLFHISVNETKASTVKNADGKYSNKSGVDGLMSSTQAAYLTDLINDYWNKEKLPMFTTPNPAEGWQCNWLFDTGWYLGGIKKDCGGHPPVLNNNHTSWAILVLNGMATDADSLNHNHRLQIAFDVVNSRIYMRRGWMSENTWAENWDDVGRIAAGSVTGAMLSVELQTLLTNHETQIDALKKPVHQMYDFTKGDMLGWSAVRGAASILSGDGLIPCAWIRNDTYCGMRVRLGNAINFVDGRTYKAIIYMAANHGSDPLRVGVEFWKADGSDNHIVKQSFLDVAHDSLGHQRYEVTFTYNAADFAGGDGGVYMCIFSAPNITSTNIFVSSVEFTEETDVVGALADLETASKSDLVSAVNELTARIAALEGKA